LKQYLSIPVQYKTSTQLQEDDLKIPVEILVMHDKTNLNKSNFEFEVIDADVTKESIKNIPILGYIKKIDGSDAKDFSGHEMEIVFKDGEIEVIYLERPIGVVPETNQYEYVEKNGKKYVKVIGYLWKDYINQGYEILQENPNKSVSMEIVVDAYEVREDGIIDIKAYRYTGITILGDNILPGMEGASMRVLGKFDNNQKFSQEFYKRVEQLNKELNSQSSSLEGGEAQTMGKKKEGDNMDMSFSVTYNQRREALRNALDPVIVRDGEDKIIEETYYWVSDFDDEFVYVEKNYWTANDHECTYGRVKYSFDEATITATVDMSSWEKMIKVWLTEAENQKIQEDRSKFESTFEENEQLKTKLAEFESAINEKDVLISQLTEYKNKNEFEIVKFDIESLVEEFEPILAENEEFKALKNNISQSFEKGELFIELDALEKELYAIEGKMKHKPNTNKQKKQNFSRVSIDTNISNTNDGLYGSAEKYIKKEK
jgi:hypothetical protein